MKKAIGLTVLMLLSTIPALGQPFFMLHESGWLQRLVRRTTVTSTTGIAGIGGTSMVQDYDGNTYYQDQNCRIFKITPAGTETAFATGLSNAIGFCYGLNFTPGRKSFLVLADLDPAQTDRAIVEIYPALLEPVAPPQGLLPFGNVDTPSNNATFPRQSTVLIAGWALSVAGIGHVDIVGVGPTWVGEVVLGTATLGVSRLDVLTLFPGFGNPNAGWSFSIASSTLLSELGVSAGYPLTLIIRAYDSRGVLAELKRLTVTVAATSIIE